VLLRNKPGMTSRFFLLSAIGVFLCLVLVLLTAFFLQVTVVLTPVRAVARVDFLLFFLKVFSVAGAGLFIYAIFRISFSKKWTRTKNNLENHTQTGFVINTFEGLIQELKIKEEALEQSKKKAEEHAKRIESYNEIILQSVPSGVLSFNCEKIITTFNTAAGIILGLSPENVLNKSFKEVFYKNHEMVQLLSTTLEEERNMLRRECVIEQSDSKKVWLGLNTSLLRDRKHQIIGATLVFTDLTEKKMLEEQVALKKRLVMMGEMSGWIAHEITETIWGRSWVFPVSLKKNCVKMTLGRK